MTEGAGEYLERRRLRTASRRLTQHLVLGLGIGVIALAVGLYYYLFAAGGHTPLWKTVAGAGVFLMALTLIAPFLWEWPERGIRAFGNWIGHALMTALLVFVYYVFFWPVGYAIRRIKGSDPMYEWDASPPAHMEGWRPKEFPADVRSATAESKGKGRVGLFGVLSFFARRGHYFLIPALLVLVSLGIALFFLQTSALAPFIYTLF